MEEEKNLTEDTENIESVEVGENQADLIFCNDTKDILEKEEKNEETEVKTENEKENNKSEKEQLIDEIAKEIVNKLSGGKASTIDELKDYFATELSKNDKKSENNTDFLQICDEDIKKIQGDFPSLDKEFILDEINGKDFKKFVSFNKESDISTVYKNYVDYKIQIDTLATEKARIMYSKRFASPGSMHSSNLTKILTWDNMNDEDFERAISDAKKGYYSKK